MRQLCSTWFAATVVIVLTSIVLAPARADTISYELSTSLDNDGHTFQLPQLDPAVGTPNSAQVTFALTGIGLELEFTNTGTAGEVFSASEVRLGIGLGPLPGGASFDFDPVISFQPFVFGVAAGTTDSVLLSQIVFITVSPTITSPSDLASFVGTGGVPVDVVPTVTFEQLTLGPNLVFDYAVQGQAKVTVTYDYTPATAPPPDPHVVPLPAAAWGGVALFGAMGLTRLRRRSA